MGAGQGGGLFNQAPADHLLLANTLLADNFVSTTLNACSGPLTSLDYSLFDRAIGCAITGAITHNAISVTSAFLTGPLADNGGPTRARGLLPGHPALAQIPHAQCHDLLGAAPAPDQRGVPRPAGANCDIGAVQGALTLFPYFRNLVLNGDAETSVGSSTGKMVGQIPWGAGGQFTPVAYGAGAPGGFPSVISHTVPANPGASFFAGGRVPASSGIQHITLPAINSSIDAGAVKFVLSADLGGFDNQDDYANVSAFFEDQSFAVVGVATSIGPLTAVQRGHQTGFVHVASGPVQVPVHARFLVISIGLVRVSPGSDNDGCADNIAFVLLPPAAVFLPLVRR